MLYEHCFQLTYVPCCQNICFLPTNIFQPKNNLRWIYPPTQDSSGKWIKVYFGIPEAKTVMSWWWRLHPGLGDPFYPKFHGKFPFFCRENHHISPFYWGLYGFFPPKKSHPNLQWVEALPCGTCPAPGSSRLGTALVATVAAGTQIWGKCVARFFFGGSEGGLQGGWIHRRKADR